MNRLRRWWHGVVLNHSQFGTSRYTGEKVDDPRSPYIYWITEEGWLCDCGYWFKL